MATILRPHRREWADGVDVLDVRLEESLLFGQATAGTSPLLRTADDWRRHWGEWRDTIMAKVIEHRPGTRPFAAYVVGEIPSRPVLQEPPRCHTFLRLYVPDGRDGAWHCAYPEPFMQGEADYLHDLGIVDDDEHTRWRQWVRQGRPARYPFELGLFT
jgi:hypothetical protein